MQVALYQPDIPQNTGTILRMCACLGVESHIIGPSGFPTSDRAFRRAGMDYLDAVKITRHRSWFEFVQWRMLEGNGKIILLTTSARTSYLDLYYYADDILLLGRESAGVPPHVHEAADASVKIPMQPGLRSLNVAIAAAIVLGEGLRQTRGP